ncbi:hypothetical protein EGJ52_21560 [Pseudomonas luteola]|uniref:hypothetical protein n=1 Tax=Pseudomonas luteola TaxID=47886 RepID=UPI000F7B3E64|nr:hypothetical protein [Pseudomonas luteola]RRW40379.1 hypothetical protein EGJ52_21560 [Pseudomonas luteola]
MKEIGELERLFVAHKSHMALLPILEYSYPAVLDELPEHGVITERLLAEVIDYSLAFPTRHWAWLAASWMESGFPISQEICDKLLAVSANKAEAQKLRHRCFALARRWQRANGI